MLNENLRNLGYRSYAPGRVIGFVYSSLHREAKERDVGGCAVQAGKKADRGRDLGPSPEQPG